MGKNKKKGRNNLDNEFGGVGERREGATRGSYNS